MHGDRAITFVEKYVRVEIDVTMRRRPPGCRTGWFGPALETIGTDDRDRGISAFQPQRQLVDGVRMLPDGVPVGSQS